MQKGGLFFMTTKKKNGRQNYDWELIKNDYVSSNLSLRKIAEKYQIQLATVSKKSKADNWFATKQQFKEEVSAKVRSKLSTKKANSLTRLLGTADKLLESIEQTVADEKQFNRHIVTESAPAPDGELGTVTVVYEKEFSKKDTKAIRDLTASIKQLSDVLGYIPPDRIEKQKLERERFEHEKEMDKLRLELEQQKAMNRKGAVTDETKVGVIIMPPIKEVADE